MLPIVFTFTPTLKDFAHAMREYQLHQIGKLRLVLMAVGLPAFGIAVFLDVPLEPRWLVYVPFLVVLYLMLNAFWLEPRSVVRKVRSDERLTVEVTWEASEVGLATRSRYMEYHTRWGDYAKAVETQNYYVLVFPERGRVFQIVPKRALNSPQLEETFRELIFRRVRPMPVPASQHTTHLVILGIATLVIVITAAYAFAEGGIEKTVVGPVLAPQYFFPGKPARWDEICNYAGKRKSVALDGYLSVPEWIYCDHHACTVELEKQPYGDSVDLEIRVDQDIFARDSKPVQGDHMADLPEEFEYEDFVVISHFGEPLYMGDAVRVSGWVEWGEASCVLVASYIEAGQQ